MLVYGQIYVSCIALREFFPLEVTSKCFSFTPARSQASAAVYLNSSAFWDVTQCRVVQHDVVGLRIGPIFKGQLDLSKWNQYIVPKCGVLNQLVLHNIAEYGRILSHLIEQSYDFVGPRYVIGLLIHAKSIRKRINCNLLLVLQGFGEHINCLLKLFYSNIECTLLTVFWAQMHLRFIFSTILVQHNMCGNMHFSFGVFRICGPESWVRNQVVFPLISYKAVLLHHKQVKPFGEHKGLDWVLLIVP